MSNNILFSKIVGSNEKHLLILHGLFGQLDNWGTLGNRFAENFTVHLLDARNHGRSFHSAEMSHELMAEDLLNYIEAQKIDSVDLIGHSLGGKAAMYFALEHPTKLKHLLVADIAPKAYAPHHLEIIKALKNLDFSQIERRSDADDQLKALIKNAAVRQFLLKSLNRKKNGTYELRFNLDALSKNYNELIGQNLPDKKFEGETLFLGGGNSSYIEKGDEILIHRYFPRAEIKQIQQAGHWLHAEKPDEFYEISMNFFKP